MCEFTFITVLFSLHFPSVGDAECVGCCSFVLFENSDYDDDDDNVAFLNMCSIAGNQHIKEQATANKQK